MTHRSILAAVVSLYFSQVSGFSIPMTPSRRSTTTTQLSVLERGVHADDSADFASPLQLTTEDLDRLQSLKSSTVTMPILILDTMLPNQELTIDSSDPKMARLIHYCLENNSDIGILGLNPSTGAPLSRGVTVSVKEQNIQVSPSTMSVVLSVKGERRMEVQSSQPWMDKTGSFFFSNVELIDSRKEPTLSPDQQTLVQHLSDTIPQAVKKWTKLVIKSGQTDKPGLRSILDSLGPMPEDNTERAFWVAAALNPLPTLNACIDIRPAMLSCTNDHERMILACQALQSSTDHLSGKRRLF